MKTKVFNTLKSRITIPVVLVVSVLIGVSVWFAATSAARTVERIENERLHDVASAVTAHLEALRQQTVAAAAALASSGELIRHLNAGNREDVWQYIADRRELLGIDSIVVTDDRGMAVARSLLPQLYGDDISGGASISTGLRGEMITLYMPTPTAPIVLTTAMPIFDGEQLIGVVAVNFDVGMNRFLEGLNEIFGAEFMVFVPDGTGGGISVSATLTNPDTGEPLIDFAAQSDAVSAVFGGGQPFYAEIELFDIPYLAYFIPLQGVPGAINGMLFLGYSLEETLDTIAALRSGMVIINVIGLVVAAVFMFFLISRFMRPLDDLRLTVKEVAAGNIDVVINQSKSLPKEIRGLASDVASLADVVHCIVDDLSDTYAHYLDEGNMHYKIDESKYKNSFRTMVGSVNALLENIAVSIRELAETMQAVGEGDFDRKLDESKWAGEWMVIPQASNNLSGGLKAVSAEINTMTKAMSKGHLSIQINTSKYKGDWGTLMDGLNNIANAVNEPLSMIEMAMRELQVGNFNLEEIDKKLEAAGLHSSHEYYEGVFKNIALAFDEAITAVSSYISEISETLAKMSKGDLTLEISRWYVGDFFELKESINSISQTLNKTMSGISAAADQVLAGANQISGSASHLSSGAQEQSVAVQELNAQVEKISNQTRKNAENAIAANELSNKSTATAQEGSDAMEQMVNAMTQIKESSNNISQIVKTVQDIAFQTNLLALNASVEAARAGEHGRGFAVVADEVRTLAGRSQVAATETTALITDSIGRVDSGANIAETTAESLNAIVASAGEVLDVISSISAASKEQAEAIAQISGGISQISDVTQSNSAVSEEAAAASEQLNAQAEMLRQLVGYFKL